MTCINVTCAPARLKFADQASIAFRDIAGAINPSQDLEIAFVHEFAAHQRNSGNVFDDSAGNRSESWTWPFCPALSADNNDVIIFTNTHEHVAR